MKKDTPHKLLVQIQQPVGGAASRWFQELNELSIRAQRNYRALGAGVPFGGLTSRRPALARGFVAKTPLTFLDGQIAPRQ